MAELVFNIDNTALQKVRDLQISANFDEMKATLTEIVEPFQNMIVTSDSVSAAKGDRAKLNKVVKSIDDGRKVVKKFYMEPLTAFENKCNELIAICNKGVDNLDSQIKAFETQTKREKVQELSDYFNENNTVSEFLSFESIANQKWSNLTYSNDTARREIDDAISRTKGDIDAIKSMGSKFENLLFDEYKKSRSIASVLNLKKRLDDAEKAAALEEKERSEREKAGREQKAAMSEQSYIAEEHASALAPNNPDDSIATCPCCGSNNYNFMFISRVNGVEVGCSDCVRWIDAYDYSNELAEAAQDEYENRMFDEARDEALMNAD